jgi:hypothetical protein
LPDGRVDPLLPGDAGFALPALDPASLERRADADVEALMKAWLVEPTTGPPAMALAALPDRDYAARLANGTLGLAVVDSLSALVGTVLPWAPTIDGSVDALLAVAPDGIAVLETGLDCAPAEAGAFESVTGVSVTVAPDAELKRWSVHPDIAFAARAAARLCCACALVGVAEASLRDAIAYGSTRIVFGQPVLGHQANAFELAACATGVDAARQALARAVRRDGPAPFGWAASQAYLQARESALAATDLGVQLHGGHGYLQGRPTERFFREVRMLSLLWGGADAALDDLTDRALDAPEWTWP